ncbi:hypothetical protein NN561_015455 [Cricetulus griseus]
MARATRRRRSRRWEVHGRTPQMCGRRMCGRSWRNLAGAIQHLSPPPSRPVPPSDPVTRTGTQQNKGADICPVPLFHFIRPSVLDAGVP